MENATPLNVYQKLQKCRVALQQKALRKSGKNSFAGYSYYELKDFLPAVNELYLEHGLCSIVSFDKEIATLTIVNSDNPEEKIIFTSPMASAQLKGCHEIQCLGAVESYQRRYLHMTALEIVESDALDATTGADEPSNLSPKPSQPGRIREPGEDDEERELAEERARQYAPKQVSRPSGAWATKPQIGKIHAVRASIGKTNEWLQELIAKSYGVTEVSQLTKEQASKFIKDLEAIEARMKKARPKEGA